ncbi:MAG: T9SS type A sorting domain-containing protein [Bacteroidales bacterium]|nr:T9SS type A sorting domain-containing protein [Bacteroidales bacterium]MCF8404003.1 T9SS type A sorting domain-containing protein [Bacteroidales bacterium]
MREKVQLINLAGKTLLVKAEYGNKSEIDVADFEPGIYFIKVFYKNKVVTRKLVIN